MQRTINICEDTNQLITTLAQRLVTLINRIIESKGSCHLALSGGSTPPILYTLLTQPPFINNIPWQKLHIYFTDERYVPKDHRDSNYFTAYQCLLRHVPIPQQQIHRMVTEITPPTAAAKAYAQTLMQHLPRDQNNKPYCDIALLGIGPDGHIASLFPQTEILNQYETLADAIFVPPLQAWRISLTFALLNHCQYLIFLAAGENKAPIIRQVLQQSVNTSEILPAHMLQPINSVEWYLDSEASALLTKVCGVD